MRLGTIVGIFILGVFFLVTPFQAFAEDPILGGSLVPTCDAANQSNAGFGSGFAGACQLCDFVTLANNIVRFAVAFTVIVATLMFAYAGALYFTAAASEANIKKAHGIFSKVFSGLVIVLIAWLLVHLFMQTLTNQDELGPWHEIRCVPYPVGESLAAIDNTRVGARPPTTPGRGTRQCSSATTGACAETHMSRFGASARDASAVCMAESGGNVSGLVGMDRLENDPQSRLFSFGLFQINATVHRLTAPECSQSGRTVMNIDCPSAFACPGGGTCPSREKIIVNEALYATCSGALRNAACNIATAHQIWNNNGQKFDGGGRNPVWSAARACGVN